MKFIFLSFIFLFFDFSIDVGSFTIGILPAFVGYLLLRKGVKEMAAEYKPFADVRYISGWMAIFMGVIYITKLLRVWSMLGLAATILNVLTLFISFYVAFIVVKGISEMEKKYAVDMGSDRMTAFLKALAIFQAAALILTFIPVLALACSVFCVVFAVIFVVTVYKAWKAYEEIPR